MEEVLGVEAFVEVGPGNVLSGLNRRIVRSARATGISDPDQLRQLLGGGRRQSMMLKLDGKTALVTGASQGIGEAIAKLARASRARAWCWRRATRRS